MEYLLLIVGFVLLTFAADWLVDGASGLAKRLNVSDLVVGLTIVAFGASTPKRGKKWSNKKDGNNNVGERVVKRHLITAETVIKCLLICLFAGCEKTKNCTFRFEKLYISFLG